MGPTPHNHLLRISQVLKFENHPLSFSPIFPTMPEPRTSLDPILKPAAIAVIGASRSPNTIGNQILSNLVTHGFTGAVYPVNPNAPAIHAIKVKSPRFRRFGRLGKANILFGRTTHPLI